MSQYSCNGSTCVLVHGLKVGTLCLHDHISVDIYFITSIESGITGELVLSFLLLMMSYLWGIAFVG